MSFKFDPVQKKQSRSRSVLLHETEVLKKKSRSQSMLPNGTEDSLVTSSGAVNFDWPLPSRQYSRRIEDSGKKLINKGSDLPVSDVGRKTRSKSRNKTTLPNKIDLVIPIVNISNSYCKLDSLSPINKSCTLDSFDSDVEIKPKKTFKVNSKTLYKDVSSKRTRSASRSKTFAQGSPDTVLAPHRRTRSVSRSKTFPEDSSDTVLAPHTNGNTSGSSSLDNEEISFDIFNISAPKTSRFTCLLDKSWEFENLNANGLSDKKRTLNNLYSSKKSAEETIGKHSSAIFPSPWKNLQETLTPAKKSIATRNSTVNKAASKRSRTSKKSLSTVLNKADKSTPNVSKTLNANKSQSRITDKSFHTGKSKTSETQVNNITFSNQTTENSFVVNNLSDDIDTEDANNITLTLSSPKNVSEVNNGSNTIFDFTRKNSDTDTALNSTFKKSSKKGCEQGLKKSMKRPSKKVLKRTKSEAFCDYLAKLINSSDCSDASFDLSATDETPPKSTNRTTFSVSPRHSFLANKDITTKTVEDSKTPHERNGMLITRSSVRSSRRRLWEKTSVNNDATFLKTVEEPKTPEATNSIVMDTRSSVRKSQRKLWDKPLDNSPLELAKKKEIFEFELMSPKPSLSRVQNKNGNKIKKKVTLFENVIDLCSPKPTSKRFSRDSDVIFLGRTPLVVDEKSRKKPQETPLRRMSTFTKDTPETSVVNDLLKKRRTKKSSSVVILCDSTNDDNFEASKNVRSTSRRLRRSSSLVLTRNVSEFFDVSGIPSSTVVGAKAQFSILRKSSSVESVAQTVNNKKKNVPSTSTPHPKKKKANLLIKALENQASAQKSANKIPARTKLPNFAKIHQKNFDRMENISEMVQRKAARAEFLLSGNKSKSFLTETDTNPNGQKVKKQLLFPYTNRDVVEKIKELSPLGNKSVDVSQRNTSKNTSRLNQKSTFGTPKPHTAAKTKENVTKIPKPTHRQRENNRPLTPLRRNQVLTPVNANKCALPLTPNTVEKPFKITQNNNKGVTRYGFKVGGVGKVTKEEQMKAISTKTMVVKNTTEKKRNELKGVRTNRRFELLMKMRNGK